MEKVIIDEYVNEYSGCMSSSEDEELRMVEAAIFIEDCFGLVLKDDEFSMDKLGNIDALKKFLSERIGS